MFTLSNSEMRHHWLGSKQKCRLIIVTLFFYGGSSWAQGCLFDPIEAAKQPTRPPYKNLGNHSSQSIKTRCPKIIGDQKGCKSSVAWALSYYGLSIKPYEKQSKSSPFSPYFICEATNRCEKGMFLEEGFYAIKKYQNNIDALPAYANSKPNCGTASAQMQPKTKLVKLYQADTSRNEIAQNAAIDSLMRHLEFHLDIKNKVAKPVILILRYHKNLENIKGNNATVLPFDALKTTTEYHAVCVVGYQVNYDLKKGYNQAPPSTDDSVIEFVNSWGAQWGNQGFAKINRKDIPQVVMAAYLLEEEKR